MFQIFLALLWHLLGCQRCPVLWYHSWCGDQYCIKNSPCVHNIPYQWQWNWKMLHWLCLKLPSWHLVVMSQYNYRDIFILITDLYTAIYMETPFYFLLFFIMPSIHTTSYTYLYHFIRLWILLLNYENTTYHQVCLLFPFILWSMLINNHLIGPCRSIYILGWYWMVKWDHKLF